MMPDHIPSGEPHEGVTQDDLGPLMRAVERYVAQVQRAEARGGLTIEHIAAVRRKAEQYGRKKETAMAVRLATKETVVAAAREHQKAYDAYFND